MENNIDKRIVILRHRYLVLRSENRALQQEVAELQFEVDKLRQKAQLTDEKEYEKFLFGDIAEDL